MLAMVERVRAFVGPRFDNSGNLSVFGHGASVICGVAIAASKARWARVNARFDPPQDDASLTDRLNLNRDSQGYDIGAPESDEAAA